jgi:hypothetical protein
LGFSLMRLQRMSYYGILCCVALVRTDVSVERISSTFRVTRIGDLGTTRAVTSNNIMMSVTANVVPSSPILVALLMEAIPSSETSVLTTE